MDLIEDGQPIDASILNALYQKIVDAEAKSNAVITATGNLGTKYMAVTQSGIIDCATDGKTEKTFDIAFDQEFGGTPQVFITPRYTSKIIDGFFTISYCDKAKATVRHKPVTGGTVAQHFTLQWMAVYMQAQV